MDYQRDFSGPDVQKSIFEKQLLLAEKLGKPVLIHERSAQMDVLDMLEKYVVEAFDMRVANDALNEKCSRTIIVVISNLILLLFVFSVFVRRFPNIKQVVIRCFMGTIEEGSLYLERGYYLGFTGYLCKVNINMTNDDLVRIEYIVFCGFCCYSGQIRYGRTKTAGKWFTAIGSPAGRNRFTIHVPKYQSFQVARPCEKWID